MGSDLNDAFWISNDGSIKKHAVIFAPGEQNDYLVHAPHALVKNEVFIFGGQTNARKIAKLESCKWIEQATQLINAYLAGSSALSIKNGNNALVCFDVNSQDKCEIFNGEYSYSTFTSKYRHWRGKLGLYQGKPTTVGNEWSGDTNKVETLGQTCWLPLPDFPNRVMHHVLMGLPSGNLLLAGGSGEISLWLLQYDIWQPIGDLQDRILAGSAVMITNSIFVVSGWSGNAIERLDFRGDYLISQRVIGKTFQSQIPVLYEVTPHYCV